MDGSYDFPLQIRVIFRFFSRYTLPKTNISPENRPSQKESNLRTTNSQVQTVSFRECNFPGCLREEFTTQRAVFCRCQEALLLALSWRSPGPPGPPLALTSSAWQTWMVDELWNLDDQVVISLFLFRNSIYNNHKYKVKITVIFLDLMCSKKESLLKKVLFTIIIWPIRSECLLLQTKTNETIIFPGWVLPTWVFHPKYPQFCRYTYTRYTIEYLGLATLVSRVSWPSISTFH